MSLLAKSAHAINASMVGQLVGIVLLLALPNLLSVEHFALTVYVTLVMYYAGFADLGMTLVYNRLAPSLLANGEEIAVEAFEDAVFVIRSALTLVYSLVAACWFYMLGQSLAEAAVLAIFVNLSPIAAFYLQQKTVRGGFAEYKRLSIAQALSRLLALAGAAIGGFLGWLTAAVGGMVAYFLYVRDRRMFRFRPHRAMTAYLRYVPEGLVLVGISLIWGSFLMLARVQAAMILPPHDVATYSVIHSGFQIMSGTVIAAALPVTVKIYELCQTNVGDLVWFLIRTQALLVAATSVAALVAADFAVFAYGMVFVKYTFDPLAIALVMLSLAALPFMVTAGSVLIGRGRSGRYLAALAALALAAAAFPRAFAASLGTLTPAVGQLVFMGAASLVLIGLVWGELTGRRPAALGVIALPFAMMLAILGLGFGLHQVAFALTGSPIGARVIGDGVLAAVVAVAIFAAKRLRTAETLRTWMVGSGLREQQP